MQPGESIFGIVATDPSTTLTLVYVTVTTASGGGGAVGAQGDAGNTPSGPCGASAGDGGSGSTPGTKGLGADAGWFIPSGYVATAGAAGNAGAPGANGTAGGADTCVACVTCTGDITTCNIATSVPSCGTPGQAGCGGGAGLGGAGGAGGGSSVALLVWDATINLTMSVLQAGGGGDGAGGAPGGPPGEGSSGAAGTTTSACDTECAGLAGIGCSPTAPDAGQGGHAGGLGGNGTGGGPGGDGSGGDAFAYVEGGNATIIADAFSKAAYSTGLPGGRPMEATELQAAPRHKVLSGTPRVRTMRGAESRTMTDPTKTAPALSPGDVIGGKYRVEAEIGSGGMGVVLSVKHLAMGHRLAIKVLRLEDKSEEQGAVARFVREARAAARIESDHVVRVTDVAALPDGTPYMVMEYLEGEDLRELLRRRRQLPIDEAVGYVLQACEGLAEAHAAGVIHRDLKPSNLFLALKPNRTTVLKVLDFGISKVVPRQGEVAITTTSSLMGSPLYMAPEQMRSSKDVDVRADIWSLGVILYELLAGVAPFEGESVPEVCVSVMGASRSRFRVSATTFRTSSRRFFSGAFRRNGRSATRAWGLLHGRSSHSGGSGRECMRSARARR